MDRNRRKRSRNLVRRLRRGAIFTLLALGSQSGCTREFYREWANQDVSEAVFEKSRDPRWRLDMFSKEPPSMSRFADYSDQEFPPAPPDDPATEALSPVPQAPDNRLLVPMEGTGYLELLEKWKLEREAYEAQARQGVGDVEPQVGAPSEPPGSSSPFAPKDDEVGTPMPSVPGELPPAQLPTIPARDANPTPPTPPAPGDDVPAVINLHPKSGKQAANSPVLLTSAEVAKKPKKAITATKPVESSKAASTETVKLGGPAAPVQNSGAKSGTNSPASTPNQGSGVKREGKKVIPPPKAVGSFKPEQIGSAKKLTDPAVVKTARQNPYEGQRPANDGGQTTQPPESGPDDAFTPRPLVPLDSKKTERDMLDETKREIERVLPGDPNAPLTEEVATELAGILVPKVPPVNPAAVAGLPRNARPYVLTMQQAFTIALINARVYQTQLENLYAAALTVTLQRFQFEPQFYAGLSPTTSPAGAGFPGSVPANQFLYQTLEAPGGQISTFSMGEVAGMGKLFSSGGQLLLGFANQLVFNFAGQTPIQPTVQSSLPISFFQPFLRGAGRAVVLETLTQAERSLLYQVRAFAKFRQEFIVTTLTGGTIANFGTGLAAQGFSGGGNTDPALGFIPTVTNFGTVIIDRRNVAYFEQLALLYEQLIEGEASGLSRLQVDQVRQNLIGARSTLVSDVLQLRNQLDQYKWQLGMPPDTPLVLDLSLIEPFMIAYENIDNWQAKANRLLDDIPRLVDQIPDLEDLVIDGHSILNIYRDSTTYDNEDELEETLQAAVRVALEYRLDLMNQRAALYDAWRQIRVRANALRGYLNVRLTNQIFTPPTTTNPFAFVDQAKQFNLIINAELPLVRVAERNAFQAAIISYQQARRQLQAQEDNLKYQLRSGIRGMQQNYIQYQITKQRLELNIRLKDQAFEQIIAPPQGTGDSGGGLAAAANAATQTSNLLNFQGQLIGSEQQLLRLYQSYQSARLQVYRDLGTLPYDEWEAFSELFPAEYRGPSLGPGTTVSKPASVEEAQPAENLAR